MVLVCPTCWSWSVQLAVAWAGPHVAAGSTRVALASHRCALQETGGQGSPSSALQALLQPGHKLSAEERSPSALSTWQVRAKQREEQFWFQGGGKRPSHQNEVTESRPRRAPPGDVLPISKLQESKKRAKVISNN